MTPHRRAGASRRSGFTLMEILVATLAFTLVLAAMRTVFFNAMTLRERAVERTNAAAPRNRAADILRRDLRGLILSGGQTAADLVAEASNAGQTVSDQIVFYSTTGLIDERFPWSDLQEVSYYLGPSLRRTNAVGMDLVRAINRNLTAAVRDQPAEQRLLEGVASLDFQFFDGDIWQETWDATLADPPYPLATRVTIAFAADAAASFEPPPPLELTVPHDIRPIPSSEEEDEEAADDGGGDANGQGAP